MVVLLLQICSINQNFPWFFLKIEWLYTIKKYQSLTQIRPFTNDCFSNNFSLQLQLHVYMPYEDAFHFKGIRYEYLTLRCLIGLTKLSAFNSNPLTLLCAALKVQIRIPSFPLESC